MSCCVVFRYVIIQVNKVKVNVQVKLALEQATKVQKGSRGIALFFP